MSSETIVIVIPRTTSKGITKSMLKNTRELKWYVRKYSFSTKEQESSVASNVVSSK